MQQELHGCSWGRSLGAGNLLPRGLADKSSSSSFGQMMEKWSHAQSLEPGPNHVSDAELFSAELGW